MRDVKPPFSPYDLDTNEIMPSTLEYGSAEEFNQTTSEDVIDYYDRNEIKMGFNGHPLSPNFVHEYQSSSRGLLNKQCGHEDIDSLSVRFDYAVEDYADIFGQDNVNNTGIVYRQFFLYDDTPPEIEAQNFASIVGMAQESNTIECTQHFSYPVFEPTDVVVTDSSCRCDMTKGERVDNELYFDFNGGHCRYSSEADAVQVDEIAGQSQTAEGWPTVGSITVRIKAEDNPLVGATRTTEVSHTLQIYDKTPPVLDLNNGTRVVFNLNSSTGSVVGTDPLDRDPDAIGSGRYENDDAVGQNIWTTQEEQTFLHSSIIQHSAGYVKDAEQLEALRGFGMCTDTCGSSLPITITTEWYQVDVVTACADLNVYLSLTSLQPGAGDDIAVALQTAHTTSGADTFMLKYTCTDTVGNEVAGCRTVINQDHTRPIINPITTFSNCPAGLNGHFTCFSASPTATYTDEGAMCSDTLDGDISEGIVVNAGEVDMSTVGSYFIQYDCQDSSGNHATTTTRTVIVLDETCPVCPVTTYLEQTIEASFPFAWATEGGATCTDDMNFLLGGAEGVGGTTIEATYEWHRRDHLGELHDPVYFRQVDLEQTGIYYITYTATDGIGNSEQNNLFGVPCNSWVDVSGADGAVIHTHAILNLRTITVVDTIMPQITLSRDGVDLAHGTSHWHDTALLEESRTSQWSWIALAIASAGVGVVFIVRAGRRSSEDAVVDSTRERQRLNPTLAV